MTPTDAQDIARSHTATTGQYQRAARVLAAEVDRLNDRHVRVMREYAAALAERDEWRGLAADLPEMFAGSSSTTEGASTPAALSVAVSGVRS